MFVVVALASVLATLYLWHNEDDLSLRVGFPTSTDDFIGIFLIFTVFLGVELIVRGPFEKLFRTDRFYHSLFQLGLSHLNHLLKSCLPIPDLGPLPPPDSFEHVVLAC